MLGGGLRDPIKLANAGRIVGMAFCAAYHVMRVNREAVDRIADVLVQRREIYGDDSRMMQSRATRPGFTEVLILGEQEARRVAKKSAEWRAARRRRAGRAAGVRPGPRA